MAVASGLVEVMQHEHDGALGVVVLGSIAVGAKPIALRTVLDALFHYDASTST